MTSLLNRLFGRTKRGSGATAKNRLHFVLQHDRINLPPERAEEMKKEILAVIVRYLAVDQDRVEIALEQRDRLHSKLVAELPIVSETYRPESQQPRPADAISASAESNGAGKPDETDSDNASKDCAVYEEKKEPVADKAESKTPEDDDKS